MEKKEYEQVIYNTDHNELGFLWDKVSSLFGFSLVKYDSIVEKILPNQKIIYHNKEQKTVIIIDNLIIFDAYAIKDEFEQNRYFVGFKSYGNYTGYNILGMIIYFDSEGVLKEKRILSKILCNYDARNGFINTYLYKQSLVFLQIHRDTKNPILNIVLLSYLDNLITKVEFYLNGLKCDTIDTINNKINYRFLHIKTEYFNYLFDLGSTKIIKNNSILTFKEENKLVINSYKTDNDDLYKFYNSLINNPEEEYNDEYPDNCIHCSQITSNAVYDNMGFGNGYCFNCSIRYSKSDKKWYCCKLQPTTNYLCGNIVDKNNYCSKQHSTTMEICINYTNNSSLKYPYKQFFNITKKNI